MSADVVPPQTDELVFQRYRALMDAAREHRMSDLHLRAKKPPYGRVAGRLVAINQPVMTSEEILRIVEVTAKRSREVFEGNMRAFEYSFEEDDVARIRCHAFREQNGWALAIRTIPLFLPGFADLRLPPVVKQFSDPGPGLILVTGPTGSGKSTSCAAVIEYVATTTQSHIVTVEDPIEYRIKGNSSLVTQREVGRDVGSFVDGLHAAMREDPDVLFVGEIRDRDGLDAVLTAADTGHMVVSTFHTPTALHTIRRIVGSYPPDDQPSVRERLADALRGILSQRLLPRADGHGRVLATEVLVNNFSVKEYIRDPVKLRSISQHLERSNDQNMHTIDQSLVALVRAKLIDPNVALVQSESPTNLRRTLGIS